VHEGAYYEHIDLMGKVLTLRSTDPNDPNVVRNTIINGSNSGTCITINSGQDANVIIDGLCIADGNAHQGGGIYCYQTSTTIKNCIITRNSAHPGSHHSAQGAGMYCYNSNLRIENCTFTKNDARDWFDEYASGGGLYVYYGNMVLNGCSFSENYAWLGGGVFRSGWQPENYTSITNCTFVKNSAYNQYVGRRSDGGAIYSFPFSKISSCIFINNCARLGGAVFGGEFKNCLFSGNSAICGGAIADSTKITNCTVTGNSAEKGGGMYCFDYLSEITNTIFYDNIAANGFNINYSDIEDGQPAIYIGQHNTFNWGPGNIDVDPCFVNPGHWDPNNTPTDANDDFWVDGDYHLKSAGWRWDDTRQRWDWDNVTSRCIDAGNPGSPLADEPLTIPDDPNNLWGHNHRINMGFYGGTARASMPPYGWSLLCDINNDGTLNLADFAWFASVWMQNGNGLFADFNRDFAVDTNDLQLLTDDWLLTTEWH
jgi:hypothetical protein